MGDPVRRSMDERRAARDVRLRDRRRRVGGQRYRRRLSESGRFRVLLLEAGDGRSAGSGSGCRSAPAACCCPQRSLWRFYTEPEPHMAIAQDVLAAWAGARRLLDHQWHAVGARRAGRIRCMARRSAAPVGATRTCCPFSSAASPTPRAIRCCAAQTGRCNIVQFEPQCAGRRHSTAPA